MAVKIPFNCQSPRTFPYHWFECWKKGNVHFARATKTAFGQGIASEAERAVMPGLGREAQDYIAWRRSVLPCVPQ